MRTETAVLDAELAEIIANLRLLGADIADVEVKNSRGGLPKSLRETLSALSNIRAGSSFSGSMKAGGLLRPSCRTQPSSRPT
jgi:hypothetical protein